MNKTAIKNFAIWARVQLIESAKQRAYEYEITESGENKTNLESIGGRLLTKDEKEQRRQLIAEINQKGYTQVMEEAAYTWFNRFIALRFMEVNGYLPSKVRVFTDENRAFKPEILKEAMTVEIEGLDRSKVLNLLDKQNNEALYKYLLITQCNALNKCLPYMFERIANWTELLFPNNILRPDGILGRMVTDIPEEDWTDQVQIIGWLYQYYNTELKDDTFALLKKNMKITKERIPSATQLFTPDWIVRYMVENSLGRLWIEGHPDDNLKAGWKYYLDEAEQEADVQAQLEAIRAEYRALRPQDIKVIDPCMGSGHILVYAFDVLVQIYKKAGFSERDAAQSILENNIYGLDIDDRAAQLAYFAVMMKARQYDRRIFTRNIQPHVYAIVESNDVRIPAKWRLGNEQNIAEKLVDELKDAKEYGSILNLSLTPEELAALRKRLMKIDEMSCEENLMDMMEASEIFSGLFPLVEVAEVLVQKYDIVVTNPPYMGASNMNAKLSDYIKKYYPDYKSDLFSAFMVRCSQLAKPEGYLGFLTPYVWMFIQSYEKLRKMIYKNKTIETLIQFEYSAFEEATVPICTFVFKNSHIVKNGCYLRLTDFKGGMEVQRKKTLEAIGNHNCGFYYESNSENFSKIPGSPVAYWVGEKFMETFTKGISINDISLYTGSQNITANNEKYLRYVWEVKKNNVGKNAKWNFYMKGGTFRKWYGNIDLFVDWSEEARNFYKTNNTSNLLGEAYRFREGITYTELTSGTNSFRYLPPIAVFDKKGPCIVNVKHNLYCLAFFNSCVAAEYFRILNPSMTLQVKDVKNTPLLIQEDILNIVESLAQNCVENSKTDWDAYETSWDFKRHPLV